MNFQFDKEHVVSLVVGILIAAAGFFLKMDVKGSLCGAPAVQVVQPAAK